MLFHVSIEADEPRHVAEVLAEIWGGTALPFPPVAHGSWMAFAGDDRGTMIEVYPRGTEMRETPGQNDAHSVAVAPRRGTATHIAIATGKDMDSIMAIAAREGWSAKYCRRGDAFGVIELWIDGCQLVEVLTPAMQGEYVAAVTVDNWKQALAAGMLTTHEAPEPALA